MNTFSPRWLAHVRLAILLRLIESDRQEDLRLCLLRLLAETPGGGGNVSYLVDELADYALHPTRDDVAAALAWLDRQGLVAFDRENKAPGARLLTRGKGVAEGREGVPGIAALSTVDWVQRGLEAVSLTVPRSVLEEQLAWMVGERLVLVRAGVVIATARGELVAQGREICDGVQQPSAETMMRMAAANARRTLGG